MSDLQSMLNEFATPESGDLRVETVGLVNSEVSYKISEFHNGAWELVHDGLSGARYRRFVIGCFIYRNQNNGNIAGDYRASRR